MKLFVVYDPATGEITGRMMVSDGQEQNYPHHLEVSDNEFNATPAPEVSKLFDLATRQLIDKNYIGLAVDKTSLQSNGVDAVTITVNNLVGDSEIAIGRSRVAVSVTDNIVTFTTDTMGDYKVRFINNLKQYSLDEITLTAT